MLKQQIHTDCCEYFRAVRKISSFQPLEAMICNGPAVKSHSSPYQRGLETVDEPNIWNYLCP